MADLRGVLRGASVPAKFVEKIDPRTDEQRRGTVHEADAGEAPAGAGTPGCLGEASGVRAHDAWHGERTMPIRQRIGHGRRERPSDA